MVRGGPFHGWNGPPAVLDHPESVSALGLISTSAGGSGLTWPSAAYLDKAGLGYDSRTIEGDEMTSSWRYQLASVPSVVRYMTPLPMRHWPNRGRSVQKIWPECS